MSHQIIYRTTEVMERYRFSRATLYRKVKDRTFPPPTFLGRPNKWSGSVLEAFEQGEISLSIDNHHLGPRILPWLLDVGDMKRRWVK